MLNKKNTKKLPLVSIVMATYNGEKFIYKQLESITKQDYPNIEVIIIDDNSSDTTVEIIKQYIDSFPYINLYPSEINQGVVKAFEKATSLAKGEFIAFSDQDDIFDTNKISVLVATMEDNPSIDMVASDLRLIDSEDNLITPSMREYQKFKIINGKPFTQLLFGNFITGCSSMIRRRLLDKALPFPENCIVHDWWLSVIATSEYSGGIYLIPEQLVSYRQHGYNVIGATSGSIFAKIKQMPNYKKRMNDAEKNLKRIKGYMDRKHLWSKKDILILKQAIELYNSYLLDGSSNFFQRLSRLPLRIRFMAHQRYVYILWNILITFNPFIQETIQKYIPNSSLKNKI